MTMSLEMAKAQAEMSRLPPYLRRVFDQVAGLAAISVLEDAQKGRRSSSGKILLQITRSRLGLSGSISRAIRVK